MRYFIVTSLIISFYSASVALASGATTVFPSTQGSTWHYRYSTGGSYSVTVTSASPNRFTEKQHGSVHAILRFKRSAKGWVSGDIGHAQTMNANGHKIVVKILHASGVVVPRTALWKPGFAWSFTTTDLTKMADRQYVVTANTQLVSNSKITGMKTVKVPAGSFHCYRVRTIEHVITKVKVGKASRIQHAKIKITEYYAKGVGLVERKAYHTTTELTHYQIK